MFTRENDGGKEFAAIPLYEYIGLAYGDPEEGGFSLHANGWARHDFGDQEYYQDENEGYLLDGFVQYAHPSSGLNFKVGRHRMFGGLVNDSVDGASLNYRAGAHIALLAYGGYPVGYEDLDGRSGDYLYGGRFGLKGLFPGEAGLSLKKLANDADVIENRLGADISFYTTRYFSFSGKSFWNLEAGEWGEHDYFADLYLSPVVLKATYQQYRYEDYFSGGQWSQILGYLQDTNETLTVVGGDVVLQQFHSFDAGLKVNHYTYERRGDASRYLAFVANVYGRGQTSLGAEAGTMVGEADENNYYLGRAFGYWDAPFTVLENWFLDAEVMLVVYKEAIYGADTSFYASAGCGRRMLDDTLKVTISGDFSSDPYHDADLRFMTAVVFAY